MTGALGRLARRVGLAWLAFELGAGILALSLLVALLPLVVLAFPLLWGSTLPTWLLALTLLSLSAPLAFVLARSSLKLPAEIARDARRPGR